MDIGDIVRIIGSKDGLAYILRGKLINYMGAMRNMLTPRYNVYSSGSYTTTTVTSSNTSGTPYPAMCGGLQYPTYGSQMGSYGNQLSGNVTYTDPLASISDDIWMMESIGDGDREHNLKPESELEVDVFLTEVYKTPSQSLESVEA